MAVNYINDISELPPHTVVELRRFFEDYKKLEHKQVIVEQFLGRDDAYKIINEAIDHYNKEKEIVCFVGQTRFRAITARKTDTVVSTC